MEAKLFWNKSDKRYIKKELSQVGNNLNVSLIEPTSVTDPDIILAPSTEVMKANYIYLKDFGRYYYINNYTFEYERIIAHCHVDVLMSFAPEILTEKIIIERTSRNLANFYLNDNELKMYNYSLYETIPFKAQSSLFFDDDTEQMVMVCSGNV